MDPNNSAIKRLWCNIFSNFSMKICVVGTHQKYLSEMLLMSTQVLLTSRPHNICFCEQIRKISGPSCSKLKMLLVNVSLKL